MTTSKDPSFYVPLSVTVIICKKNFLTFLFSSSFSTFTAWDWNLQLNSKTIQKYFKSYTQNREMDWKNEHFILSFCSNIAEQLLQRKRLISWSLSFWKPSEIRNLLQNWINNDVQMFQDVKRIKIQKLLKLQWTWT